MSAWEILPDYRLPDDGTGVYTLSDVLITDNDRFFIVRSEDGSTRDEILCPENAYGNNANHGAYYRCRVTDKNGVSVYSKAAILKTAQVNITKQPGGRISQLNQNVTFEVSVTGKNVRLQWQRSTDGGNTWEDLAGYTNPSFTITLWAAHNGVCYRCVLTDKAGVSIHSNTATVTVK